MPECVVAVAVSVAGVTVLTTTSKKKKKNNNKNCRQKYFWYRNWSVKHKKKRGDNQTVFIIYAGFIRKLTCCEASKSQGHRDQFSIILQKYQYINYRQASF